MRKKEFAIAVALLSASSALCLRIMKRVDEKTAPREGEADAEVT